MIIKIKKLNNNYKYKHLKFLILFSFNSNINLFFLNFLNNSRKKYYAILTFLKLKISKTLYLFKHNNI